MATPTLAVEQLDATTLVEARPFTHPDRSRDDLGQLHRCVSQLRAALHAKVFDPSARLAVYEWEDVGDLPQRIILGAPDLRTRAPLTVVGFFGQRRAGADRGPIVDVDHQLVRELANHDDVLAYFTSALPGGDYANLVLCSSPDALAHWNSSPLHVHAVRALAPAYYRTIRLHNGLMADGLTCHAGPVLTCTKYYDFAGAQPWRAVRIFDPPLQIP